MLLDTIKVFINIFFWLKIL